LSSKFEGFPNSLLEALSSGLACISSDCDYGPKEIIKNRKNGILFKNNNYLDLYKKLKYLISNKKVICLYGNQAKVDFRCEKYNEDKLIKWKNIIKIN
jgi:GalNAc-alpha-(1->4)-GalNAc-alpha-(1->3)-diNAcBac-PP-undecaprenol alpha-1,4-N-acetyl-D-galactosaminyltransferase